MRSACTRNSCRIVRSIWPQRTTRLLSLLETMPCRAPLEVANPWTKITTQSILLERTRVKIQRQCRLGEQAVVLEKCSTLRSRRYIMCQSRPNSKNQWANRCHQTHSQTKMVTRWYRRGRISSQNRLEDSWLWGADRKKNLLFQASTR